MGIYPLVSVLAKENLEKIIEGKASPITFIDKPWMQNPLYTDYALFTSEVITHCSLKLEKNEASLTSVGIRPMFERAGDDPVKHIIIASVMWSNYYRSATQAYKNWMSHQSNVGGNDGRQYNMVQFEAIYLAIRLLCHGERALEIPSTVRSIIRSYVEEGREPEDCWEELNERAGRALEERQVRQHHHDQVFTYYWNKEKEAL